ncbi:MAG: RNA-binding transcriptional accessory protein [Methanotrichaceae archaeon]|nr:RNA-binding transcriptional accessory protein [Methanotrichaceae archaeon]
MNDSIVARISRELSLRADQVEAARRLLDDGATVPFIARYRKEATGSLDELAILTIRDRLAQLRRLQERKEAVTSSLKERGLLSADLEEKITAAQSLTVLEDIYLPYRPRRRTRATDAREKGLEPLAREVFSQQEMDLAAEADRFVCAEKEVGSGEEALAGARDIIAEWISEDLSARSALRELFERQSTLRSQAVPKMEKDAGKYRDYFDWSEPLSEIASHRLLAVLRGQREGFLRLHLSPPEDEALEILDGIFLQEENEASDQVRLAIRDSYRRLILPSLEKETVSSAKAWADRQAIDIFSENLRQILLQPPLGQKNILAVDPGFKSGCKLAVLDSTGRLVHSDVIYPHEAARRGQADEMVQEICERFGIEVIAVGDGTAGRETETFLRSLRYPRKTPVTSVDESGASVYSASEIGREELPEQDVTIRGAVSIGRRLMDPLAELVKIPPESLGIGQYQHDVEPKMLKIKLDDVVVSCVNLVGVDLNTASQRLLTYVSGLGPRLAESLVRYRDLHGPFSSRQQLLKVPRLGPKAFEQSAAFLRIKSGPNPLDGTGVHPESYAIVEAMARDLGTSVPELMSRPELLKDIELKKYASENCGLPTLQDIIKELSYPGKDPRAQKEAFTFSEEVRDIEDLRPGMKLPGVVTNIVSFGAFVDIGVHQDGLVHISQLKNGFVKSPADVVKLRQQVVVKVLAVDKERKRISLSLK